MNDPHLVVVHKILIPTPSLFLLLEWAVILTILEGLPFQTNLCEA